MDAEQKAAGRSTRIGKLTNLIAMLALMAGFLLSSQSSNPQIELDGAILFFAFFVLLLALTLTNFPPLPAHLRDRLTRCGLGAAEDMNLMEALAAKWAIEELGKLRSEPQTHPISHP